MTAAQVAGARGGYPQRGDGGSGLLGGPIGVVGMSTSTAAATVGSSVSSGTGIRGATPTDLCYGMRVGIRSCAEQRYVAAYVRTGVPGSDGFDLEVSGFHPFRQSDTADRATDCPSEWVILQFSHRQHRGVVHVGDEVCFVKELATSGDRKKDRFAYLALSPSEGSAMEPVVERPEAPSQGSDLCRWTLAHAGNSEGQRDRLHGAVPLLLRGKYNECLALGASLWEPAPVFRSPARMSGRALECKGRDAQAQELWFRIVRAGVAFGPDPGAVPSAAVLPASDAKPLVKHFGSLSLREQEQALLEDVLFSFLGVDGVYVRQHPAQAIPADIAGAAGTSLPDFRFRVDIPEDADGSTVQFLEKVLPVCEHHAAVRYFVKVHSQHEYGTVNHALCSGIRELLKEFVVKVGQLETALRSNNLTIAKLWYHIQPSLDTLAVLHRVVAHVYCRTGGQVLNGIEDVMARSSITTAQDLCEFLLQQASRPYFKMLSRWLYEGRLEDPYGEFFISESPRLRDERTGGPAADFWQKHFVLEERSVPQIFAATQDKILHAGKYLHVFFSYSAHAELPEVQGRNRFAYSRRRRDYIEAIDAAYRRASAALLGLFMSKSPEGLDLPGRLRSIRGFFFLGRADWLGQLMDTACAELEQPATEVPLTRLEGLLDLALRSSSTALDPYREDITCGLHSFRVEEACHRMSRGTLPTEELDDCDAASERSARASGSVLGSAARASLGGLAAATGAEALGGVGAVSASASTGPALGGLVTDATGVRCFTLKYRTSWPLSIVFSKGLLLKYQVIFRHLLYCRYVERKLVEVWVDHQHTKELGLDARFSPSYSLRQRMLHFCRDYIYYATVEVLEPQSYRFLTSLEQAETIDEVLKNHEGFLSACLRELLLTERDSLYRGLSKVLNTCLTFATNLHKFSHTYHDSQGAEDVVGGSQAHWSAERRMARVLERNQSYLSILSQRHYSKMISKFKEIFESQLQGFLKQIRQESTSRHEHFLSNMLTRLDYNEYYSTVLTGVSSAGPPLDADMQRGTR